MDIEARIEVLRLKAGDTVVFQFPHRLTKEQHAHIRDSVTPLMPDGVKAMVVDPDVTITHLSAQDA